MGELQIIILRLKMSEICIENRIFRTSKSLKLTLYYYF